MISSELIKDIIRSNEEFILNKIGSIITRTSVSIAPAVFTKNLRKVNIIHGVRRSGKTFLLYDIFKKNRENSLYIDFEDERLRDISIDDMNKIKEGFFELKPHLLDSNNVLFLFDEVQNVEGWEKFVRRIAEKDRITVYAAGSSSVITPQKIHTSLRGRAWGIDLFPFSFPEYLKIKNLDLKNSIYGKRKVLVKSSLVEYLEWGGFPEISLVDSEFAKRKILREYLDAMYFKDLVEKFSISNIPLLETLKENLFSSYSSKFSLTAFTKKYKGKFPFSKDSLFSYYKNFLESMLIFETRIYSASAYKRIRNLPKIYLVDTGLARKVSTVDKGRLLENAVFLELKRKGFEIFYTNQDGECDFIIKRSNGDHEVLQVTWELEEHNLEREMKGLIRTCNMLNLKTGKIITFDQEESYTQENVIIDAIPFWKWILSLFT